MRPHRYDCIETIVLSHPYAPDLRRSPGSSLIRMLSEVIATRYVTPLREGGSLPGIVEADDLGTYVMKSSTRPG
ncbi:hypothetical protein OEIGOIKO_07394 [Streptomyces chrestomyceticus JCM 4735]|uniref:Uncharacterized protein n=1 Tax=Streptomyces chrestomyceticus JCM 4735 TaxID=1306181 RepID=A0A7U9L362_9ACTN|nr:hypothetical protein OEIGOIKO_07394 [Streptomyces chrestomyceticus JCM 4735]